MKTREIVESRSLQRSWKIGRMRYSIEWMITLFGGSKQNCSENIWWMGWGIAEKYAFGQMGSERHLSIPIIIWRRSLTRCRILNVQIFKERRKTSCNYEIKWKIWFNSLNWGEKLSHLVWKQKFIWNYARCQRVLPPIK